MMAEELERRIKKNVLIGALAVFSFWMAGYLRVAAWLAVGVVVWNLILCAIAIWVRRSGQ